jgi:flagellar basal-body rod modification protein FlgD
MSAVQNVTGTGTAGTASGTAAASISGTSDRFLKLLVAQMRNQDPLNPLDNAQVTSQLAQLSTVDGINKLNDSLSALSASYAESRSLQAASLVGHGVLADGSSIALKSGVALGGVELTQPADKVVVTITDPAGNVQDKIDLGPQKAGVVAFQWDGVRSDGTSASDGVYNLAVDAELSGDKIANTPLAFAQVNSVSLGGQGTLVNTDLLGAVDLSKVRQIY